MDPTAAGIVRTNIESFDLGAQGVLMASYSDFPTHRMRIDDPQALLDGAANGAVSRVAGSIDREENIQLGESLGKEITFSGRHMGRNFTAHARIYLVGDRLYQLLCIGPSFPNEQSERFVTTFQTQ